MKTYIAWVGQNASTGEPHPLTGRMSMFGFPRFFKSKSERDEFVRDYHNNDNPGEYAVSVNRKTIRAYCLGMSVRSMNEWLDGIECIDCDL